MGVGGSCESGCSILNAPRAHPRATVSTMMTFRAQTLTIYIPTTELEGIENKATYCHALPNLFRSYM